MGDGEAYEAYSTRDADLSGVYGMEYRLLLPQSRVDLVLNARYSTGFSNFVTGGDANMPNDRYRNNSLSFIVGVRF